MMNLEKVKVLHSWVTQIVTEASDIDSVISVKVKVAGKLIERVIVDEDSIVVEDIFEFCQWNLRFYSTILYLLDEVILLISLCDLFSYNDIELF